MPYVCAFMAGYTFDEVAQFLSLPSDADRGQVRAAFAQMINPGITYGTHFHVFDARPDLPELVTHINGAIMPDAYAVTATNAHQEHVWRQGSWVCETRLAIVHASSGQDLTATVTVNDILFTAHTYRISAYAYH